MKIEMALTALAGMFALFLVWMFFIMMPRALYAEKICLEQGYPKSSVTYDLSIYCTNLDGSVTFKVKKQ